MKTYKTLLLLSLLFIVRLSNAQIENVIVETYYVTTAADSIAFDSAGGSPIESGTTTYRIYIDLLPGSKLKKVYGDLNHALKFSSTAPFYNNLDGVTFAKDFNNLSLHKDATYALDTWLTIGQTTKPTTQLPKKINYGILKSQDSNSTTISSGDAILTNTALAIPLTVSDGMDTLAVTTFSPSGWGDVGFITLGPGGGDFTMFGSNIINSNFISNTASMQYTSGVRGVVPDSNQVLIAQLTTKGQLSFELNIEVIEVVAGGGTTPVKYVANDSILIPGVGGAPDEKFSSFLKYPPECGCKDPKYLEYDNKYSCMDISKCLNLIVFGCMDTMACNFDPRANYSIKSLCCYPGYCNGREIAVVCPQVNGDNFDFEIHPNPTQGNLYLSTLPSTAKEIKYSVFDAFGNLVVFKNMGITSKISNEEIELSNLNNGIYLLRIDYDGSYKSKLFLKN